MSTVLGKQRPYTRAISYLLTFRTFRLLTVHLVGIASQKESLEELYYNHAEDCRGTDLSTFDPTLLRQFPKLRLMDVPRHCFVDRHGAPHPLYTFLPPSIETVRLDQDGPIGIAEYEARLRVWLLEILENKQNRFPLLNAVELYQWEDVGEQNKYLLEEASVLERLYELSSVVVGQTNSFSRSVGTAFEEAGVQLGFHFQWT